MYDVNDYGRMMADPVRMNAYTEALRRAVKPGSVVVDVGTGTGIFALLAARFGARKVYAIDTNPCIHLAREVAKRNGYADRIEFIQKSVFDVELPEKADVLVMDCRGHFTLYGENLAIASHARTHFLKSTGIVVAEKDDLMVALVSDAKLNADFERPWQLFDFDWSVCRAAAFATPTVARSSASKEYLTDGACWATIKYADISSPDVRGHTSARALRTGTAHALHVWFRATTFGGDEFGEGCNVYRPLTLPLDPPLDIVVGEGVEISVDVMRTKGEYLYAWRVKTPSTVRRHVGDGLAIVAQKATLERA